MIFKVRLEKWVDFHWKLTTTYDNILTSEKIRWHSNVGLYFYCWWLPVDEYVYVQVFNPALITAHQSKTIGNKYDKNKKAVS